MNIRDTLFFIVVVEAKVDVKSISKKVFTYINKGKDHQKQLILDDSYLIKIESVVLSDGLSTDLTNLIDKIYNKVKTSSSSLVDIPSKQNMDKKQLFIQKRNVQSKKFQRI
jgi:hypothetical protein